MKALRTTLHSLLAVAAGILFLASTAAVNCTSTKRLPKEHNTTWVRRSRSRSKRER